MTAPWIEGSLEEALSTLIDYRGKSPRKSSDGIPVISAKVVGNGRIADAIEQKISADYYVEWMRRGLPQVGDVVMTTEGPLGEVAQLDERTARYALGQRIVVLRGRGGVLDNTFLRFLLQSPEVQRRLEARATGTTVSGISQKSLRALPIPLPPLPEQQAIAGVLGALDDKIELNRRMNATLEAMARALFRSWFVDFDPVAARAAGDAPTHMDAATAALFPDRFGDDGLPEGWRLLPIGEAAEIVGGSTPSTKNAAFWEGGELLWATPRDLSKLSTPILLDTERKITSEGVEQISSRQLPAGTLLLSSRAPIGYLAIARRPVSVNQGFIAMKETRALSSVYMLFWCGENIEAILSNANGSTFQEISKRNFRPLPAVIAPGSVLRAFDEKAGRLIDLIAANEEQSHTLAAFRDALLPKLMSGELRVREAEAQVAEVV